MARHEFVKLRLTDVEKEQLDFVAQHFGLSLSSTIRLLVKERHNLLSARKRRERRARQ
jgi:hypothetical protein